MKLKNVLISALSLVLVAAVSIGGTLAFLTSEDSDVNVMTMGKVKIAQHEYERATNEDGTYKTDTIDNQTSYVLKDFEQGKALLPIVGDPSLPGTDSGYAGYDTTPVRMSQVDSYGGMDVFAGKNAVDKFATVENTGKTDAYIRTLVAIEVGTASPALIGTSYHKTWTAKNIGSVEIDGNNYFIKEFVYNGANGVRHENGILPAGDTSYPNLSQVYIKSAATNEDCAKLDGNGNGTLEILVLSQAVQAEGFADAETALNAGFGKSSEKAGVWFGGVLKNTCINEAFSQSYDATQEVVIDGEGKEIFSYVDEDSISWGEAGNKPNNANVFTNATVSNISFTGSMMPVMSGYWDNVCDFNNTFNNVNLIGIESVGNAAGFSTAMLIYGDATLNNCNIYDTTTKTEGTKLYDVVTPTGHTTINGGKIGDIYMANAGTTLTVDGAEVDYIKAAGNKAMTITVKAGAGVEKIDMGNKTTLIIEDGATIGTIVFKGTTYTQAEWAAAQQP